MAADTSAARPVRHRPRITTVFVAAFVAGAAAAVGVNRVLDVRLAQAKPQVECEPIFVALRDLPAGSPVTVWDVALRDLPKAMVPATALRVSDSFEGRLLKFPLRAGQPLISAQLLQREVAAPVAPETPATEPAGQEALVEEAFVQPVPAPPVAAEARDPVTDAGETVVSRPVGDEPDHDPSNHSIAETVPTTETGAGDEPKPVASIIETPAVAESGETGSTSQTQEPTIAQAPQVAAGEPTPVVAAPGEPTPGAPRPVEAAPLVSLSSDLFAAIDGNFEADLDATLDMPSRPAVNLADLPSVMASGDAASAAPATGGEGSGVRYLVVPERIARQADTAFTTPVAPEAGGPTQAAARSNRGPTARPAAAPTMPPATVKQAESGRPGRPPAPQQPQGRSPSATKQQQTRPQPTTPGTAAGKPVQSTRPGQPTASVPPAAGPRAWGGMFPNVAAGLEAMGSWRTGGRGAPAQSERGSTTR